MSGKFWAPVLFAGFLLGACAQARYVSPDNSSSEERARSDGKADLSHPFQRQPLFLSWYWEQKPTSTEAGSLIFKTYRANEFDQTSIAVDLPGDVAVLLWMPGMGHGSSPTKIDRLDTGTYRASQVFFVMPGEWEIHFQSKTGSTLDDEVVIPFVF